MLERLVAGLVVIGALVWGASILATPDAQGSPDEETGDASAGSGDTARRAALEPALAGDADRDDDEEDDEEDNDEDEDRREGKGKEKRGDADV